MNRRDFLKALGLGTGVSAASACTIDDNLYFTPIEHVVPYVTRPEQTTPGTFTSFATTVGYGPHAWPAVALHREGRVTNVGANHAAPVPPAATGAHFLALQRHWSPDRIPSPRKDGQNIAWEQGLELLRAAAKKARQAGKKIAWIGPYRSGTLAGLLDTVTDGNAVHFEPFGLDAEARAAAALFGEDAGLPRFVVDEAPYVLSFGAAFLGDTWGNPGLRTGWAAGRTATPNRSAARFAAVTPLKDQTAANADDWYACAPGSEHLVALAVAKLVAEARKYSGPGGAMLRAGDVDAAAGASGLTAEAIREIAARFVEGAVALPGGLSGASGAATKLAGAVYLLNHVAGTPGMREGGYPGPVHSLADVEALVADLEGGKVGLLLVDDLDLASILPGGAFAAAMAKADTTVSVSSFPNELAFGTVLPTHDALEDWGDEEPLDGLVVLRQPGALPVGDTRSLGELLLEIWRATDPAAPTQSWRDFVWTAWLGPDEEPAAAAPPEGAPEPEDDKRRRRRGRRRKGAAEPGTEPGPAEAPAPRQIDVRSPRAQARLQRMLQRGYLADERRRHPRAEITGSMDLTGGADAGGDGAYHLFVFAHPFKLDGRFANEPWANETPDPMTGLVWDSWALVHPDTAAKLGVRDNDLVRIDANGQSVQVGVEIHPCVAPGVVAVPLGGGRTAASGRYADGVGVNVVKLLAARKDGSGAAVFQGTKCGVAAAGSRADLVGTFGTPNMGNKATNDPDDQQHRNWARVVRADEWKGDEETEEAGGLTGVHELPMDPRLVALEKKWRAENPDAEMEKTQYLDMYPVPDHPTYRFALTVDTNACNGCGACVIACYAENNIPVVGKWKMKSSREMSWMRINRYFDGHSGDGSPSVHFVPVMCQQCAHAPCESVCPVLATYHTIDGLNAMIYNRCVGTRYCANACPYSIRRFNYHTYAWPEPFNLQLNPDVSARTMGVMEKCTFCVQRIRRVKAGYRAEGFTHTVPDEALRQLTACADACPTQALSFGNLNDPQSVPHRSRKTGRSYTQLTEINTFPAVNYLARASFHVNRPGHGGGHGGGHAEGGAAEGAPHGEGH